MSLKKCSILLSSALLLLLLGCKTAPLPKLDLSIWAGDSGSQSIKRSKDEIKSSDPKFDDYACVSYADLKKIFDTIVSCKEWPKGVQMMTAGEANHASKLYSDVAKKAGVTKGGEDGTVP